MDQFLSQIYTPRPHSAVNIHPCLYLCSREHLTVKGLLKFDPQWEIYIAGKHTNTMHPTTFLRRVNKLQRPEIRRLVLSF
ncbi:MAG: hypothetical protein CFH41_00489 [Alphaproteobacteria bacterium MarineAlpha11_Bin1]|nr:MAG: hypothetical protein CFH41_00489 [Alphaproteobacteria bacterium MarineAlpha11_Bin1]